MNPTAFIINLSRRPERWKRAQEVWSKWFHVERFEAVDMPSDPARGCKLSHLSIAELILQTQGMVVVMEDDSEPTHAFNEIGLRCIEEAYGFLPQWSTCNGGPFLDLEKVGWCHRKAKLRRVGATELWLHTDFALQTHFMLYNRNSIPLLRASLDSDLPLDVFLAAESQHQWVPIRLLATQAEGPSDIGQSPKNQKHWYELSERMLEKATA